MHYILSLSKQYFCCFHISVTLKWSSPGLSVSDIVQLRFQCQCVAICQWTHLQKFYLYIFWISIYVFWNIRKWKMDREMCESRNSLKNQRMINFIVWSYKLAAARSNIRMCFMSLESAFLRMGTEIKSSQALSSLSFFVVLSMSTVTMGNWTHENITIA